VPYVIHLLTIPKSARRFRSLLRETGRYIVFSPDISADIFEKWIGFLAILFSAFVLTLATGVIAYFAADRAEPAAATRRSLTRMRNGDYSRPITAGDRRNPQELREANELARTLDTLSPHNKSLLRKIVSLQDDERHNLARSCTTSSVPCCSDPRSTIALAESVPRDKELAPRRKHP